MQRTQGIRTILLLILVLFPLLRCASCTQAADLSLLCPTEVDENAWFEVTVTADNTPIANVTMSFITLVYLTNESGAVRLQAPRVEPTQNKSVLLTAEKEGFNATTCQVTIKNIPQLFALVTSSYISENTFFTLTVVDEQGLIVDNVTVTYQNQSYSTDLNGTVPLSTPGVRKSETYEIHVEKSGFLPNTIAINVSPQASAFNLLGFSLILVICCGIIVVSLSIVLYRFWKHRRLS
ncbi:MAG: hypothetical protein JXA00_03320 [Candidatus Thermoplasmatota archaeon]|nr:hypothetical protein [Candidatus Thermoplasmatota archaeon]